MCLESLKLTTKVFAFPINDQVVATKQTPKVSFFCAQRMNTMEEAVPNPVHSDHLNRMLDKFKCPPQRMTTTDVHKLDNFSICFTAPGFYHGENRLSCWHAAFFPSKYVLRDAIDDHDWQGEYFSRHRYHFLLTFVSCLLVAWLLLNATSKQAGIISWPIFWSLMDDEYWNGHCT